MQERNPNFENRRPEWLPRCERCDTVGHIGYRYCPLCGSRLAQRCQGCGTPLAGTVTLYCVRCESLDQRRSSGFGDSEGDLIRAMGNQ